MNPKHKVTFSLDAQVIEQLRTLAEEMRTNMSHCLRLLIERDYRKLQKTNKKEEIV